MEMIDFILIGSLITGAVIGLFIGLFVYVFTEERDYTSEKAVMIGVLSGTMIGFWPVTIPIAILVALAHLAIEHPNGTKEWYVNDKRVTEDEAKQLTAQAKELTVAEISCLLGYTIKVVE